MTDDRQVQRVESDVFDVTPGAGAERAPEVHPLRKLHRHLKGRYWLLALLLLVLGGAGGWLGWRSATPLYRSEGKLYVEAAPKDVDDPEGMKVPPLLGPYIDVQVAYMREPRVLRYAMQTETWKQIGRPATDENFREFASSLAVRRLGTLLISIAATDPDPKAAQAAVNSLMQAYQELSQNQKIERDRVRLGQYEETERQLKAEQDKIDSIILGLTEEYGSKEALDAQYHTVVQILTETETDLLEVERKLLAYGVTSEKLPTGAETGTDGPEGQDGAAEEKELAPEDYAQQDAPMRELLLKAETLEHRISYLTDVKKYGQQQDKVVELRYELEFLRSKIQERLEVLRTQSKQHRTPLTEEEFLLAQRNSLLVRKQYCRNRVDELSKVVGRLGTQLRRRDQISGDLPRYARLIDELRSELAGKGRILELSRGELPTAYSVDKRQKNAVMGGFGGAGLAFLLVLLLGVRDRRIKTSSDIVENVGQLRMLGLLPELPKALEDAETVDVAVHSVHHIRAMLQITSGGEKGKAFVVTGPAPATGKTTLTHVLGLSFANAGARVLLVDCDFLGRGLTRRYSSLLRTRIDAAVPPADGDESGDGAESSPDLSVIAGSFSDRRGERITATAPDYCRGIVERLSSNGFDGRQVRRDLARFARQTLDLEERERLAGMKGVKGTQLAAEILRSPGLIGVMRGEEPSECIEEGGERQPDFLPLGREAPVLLDHLSSGVLRGVFERVRDRYDFILIDTGPIPGSVEASIVASEADSTVLVVSRGDQRPLLERAVRHLSSLGVRTAGVVFNRADQRDTMSSSASHSVSMRSRSDD